VRWTGTDGACAEQSRVNDGGQSGQGKERWVGTMRRFQREGGREGGAHMDTVARSD
jgi:hypothetical protein